MKYLLDEEEYQALIKSRDDRTSISNNDLLALCMDIANHKPVVWGWGGPDPKPWGCYLTAEHEWYCDDCPVQNICPADRSYSK